jgi:hypothetical protein
MATKIGDIVWSRRAVRREEMGRHLEKLADLDFA